MFIDRPRWDGITLLTRKTTIAEQPALPSFGQRLANFVPKGLSESSPAPKEFGSRSAVFLNRAASR